MPDTLEAIVAEIGDLLRQRRWMIAVAESVTAGRVQALLTAGSGASDFFAGGVIAYHLESKVDLLGVDAALADACDCVSREVAEQMARGVRLRFGTAVGVATTGYAEVMPEKSVNQPMAFVAVQCPKSNWESPIATHAAEFKVGGDRVTCQIKLAEAAVNFVRDTLRATDG